MLGLTQVMAQVMAWVMAQVMAQVMAWAMNDMNNAWPANSKYVHAELALVSA